MTLPPIPATDILTIAARIASLAHHGHVVDFHSTGGTAEFYFDDAGPDPRRRHILAIHRVSTARYSFTWTEIHWDGSGVWDRSRCYYATCRWNTAQLFSAIASLRERSGHGEHTTRFSFSSGNPDFTAYAEAEAELDSLFDLLSAMQDD